MKKSIALCVLLAGANILLAQKAASKIVKKEPVKAQVYNDFSVILHEETLNKVFDAIGEISGTKDYEVLLIKGKYHWKVKNPRINLKPDSSDFTCDAKVEVGPIDYSTPVKGQVKIWYDNEKNLINVQVTSAIFEVYTKVFGKKITIKKVELAEYLKDPFQFEGPKSMGTQFEFLTPDSVLKKIYIQPSDCQMQVVLKEIRTVCEVTVSDKPILPLMPPIKTDIKAPADTTRKTLPDSTKRKDEKK